MVIALVPDDDDMAQADAPDELDALAGRWEAGDWGANSERLKYWAERRAGTPYGIPARTCRAARLARETTALRKLVDWSCREDDLSNNHLVIAGPPGTGKSTAAAWIALYHLVYTAGDDPTELTWSSAHELARLASQREGDPLKRLLEASVLVVDDLGVEQLTPARLALVDELVDRVYNGAGPNNLIITTNLRPSEFRARYGERVVDRLTQCSTLITFRGKSLRRRAA